MFGTKIVQVLYKLIRRNPFPRNLKIQSILTSLHKYTCSCYHWLMVSVFLLMTSPEYNYTTLVGGVFLSFWLMVFLRTLFSWNAKDFQVHVHTTFVHLGWYILWCKIEKNFNKSPWHNFSSRPRWSIGIFTLYNVPIYVSK